LIIQKTLNRLFLLPSASVRQFGGSAEITVEV